MRKLLFVFFAAVSSIPLVFLFINSLSKADVSENAQLRILDPVPITPDWLKFQAQQVLPKEEQTVVWLPTGNFQNSSLVKVPRFPRVWPDQTLDTVTHAHAMRIVPIDSTDRLKARVVRNEVFSGQLVVVDQQLLTGLRVRFGDFSSVSGDRMDTDGFNTRFVGYVPVERAESEFDWSATIEEVIKGDVSISGTRNPDVIADPLYDVPKVDVPAYRNQPIWLSLVIPENTSAGVYDGELIIEADQFKERVPLSIEVLELSIADPNAFSFDHELWFNPYAIAKIHKTDNWSAEHWSLITSYLNSLRDLGVRSVTVPIVDEPWRVPWLDDQFSSQSYAGYQTMIDWKMREDGSWTFDYTVFDQYIKVHDSLGMAERINVYSLTAFRSKQRIYYYDSGEDAYDELFFDSPEDAEYQQIWSQFLNDFYAHLKEKGWEIKTFLSFDERPPEIMLPVTRFIKSSAPYFSDKIAIAGHPSGHEYASNSLSISYEFFPGQNLHQDKTLQVIKERNARGLRTTYYLCGQPAHPNNLTLSPAIESRVIPWIALKYGLDGYLRWSFNNWPDNPIVNPVYKFIQGDEYLIYPGGDGPLSSIRYELLRDGVEDFELFQQYAEQLEPSTRTQIIQMASRDENGNFKDVRDISRSIEMLVKEVSTTQ